MVVADPEDRSWQVAKMIGMGYEDIMAVEHEDSVEKVLHSTSSAAQSFVAASWCRSGLKHGGSWFAAAS